VDPEMSESLLRTPSFRNFAKTQHPKTILNTELKLPEKVRRKLDGYQKGSI
jgi:hypothetical protein